MNQHASIPDSSSTLALRAMIVTLHIRQWTGRRLDREVTDQVNQDHNAAADAGRYNKLLLPTDALSEVTKIVSATRTEFLERTLPWIDKGGRIMAADAYLPFTSWVNRQIAAYEAAVDRFIMSYPGYVSAAHTRLGDMFDANDYPSSEVLRKKFDIKVSVLPVPTADDFRVDMSEAQASLIRSDIEKQVTAATQDAVKDIYRRVAELTGRMATRLTEFKPSSGKGSRAEGVFRDSLVQNIRDLMDILPALNITGDDELTKLVDELRPLVAFDAKILRTDENLRASIAAEAQAIVDRVSDFI